MSSKGGGGGSTTTTQKADPWSALQGPLKQLYGSATDWFNQPGPEFFPGQTVAGQAPETLQALQQGTQRATNGSPLVQGADALNQQTVGGQYLNANPALNYFNPSASGAFLNSNPANPYFQNEANGNMLQNPYLDAMFNSAAGQMGEQYSRSVVPGINSTFSQAGRFGSGLQSQALADGAKPLAQGLSSLGSSIYGGAYENERQRQMQAAQQLSQGYQNERSLQQQSANSIGANYGNERTLQQSAMQMAPGLAQNDYTDLDKLMGIGQYRQQSAQDLINANIQKFDFGQNQPLSKLQALSQLLQGGMGLNGSTSTANAKSASNPFAGALGGAAVGNSLGGSLGGTALGTSLGLTGPIGAGLGALLGLFGG